MDISEFVILDIFVFVMIIVVLNLLEFNKFKNVNKELFYFVVSIFL